jgi:catechol 2,3-dioxygenase-like lactoylglutathione lyase family enzyme
MPAKKGHRSTARRRSDGTRTATSRSRPKPPAKVVSRRRKTAPQRARPTAGPAPAAGPVRFIEVNPSLAVRDVSRSRFFYQRLGFRVAAQLPPTGPPEWLRLERDQVALLVWNEIIAAPEVLSALAKGRGAGNAVRISVTDVDRLAREFQESGIPFQRQPETMPDGLREFTIVDPDGFLLEFVSRAPHLAAHAALGDIAP